MKRTLIFKGKVLTLLTIIGINIAALGQENNKSINKSTSENMEIQQPGLSTYILFNGTCKQAMEFYKTCLGGELTLTSVGESPMKYIFPEAMHNKTVNARLISKSIDISASDWLRPAQTPVKGNMVCLYLSGGKPQPLKDLFDKLSEEADITDPLKVEPFGMYGALNDKFGVRWMFHTDQKD
jgi:PhnB protein